MRGKAFTLLLFLSATFALTNLAQAEIPRLDAHGDPLPEGALFRFGTIRFRHSNGINSSALSPDGKLLATAGKSTVIVWDLATGKRLHTFLESNIPDGSDTNGSKVAFSPDGKNLAQISEFDVAARLWDLTTGKVIRTFGKRPQKQPGAPRFPVGTGLNDYSLLRFSPDGKELLLHGGAGILKFDAITGNEQSSISLPASPEAFSADGKQVAILIKDPNRQSGRQDLLLCSTETGKEVIRFDIPISKEYWGGMVAFAPDGKTVAMTVGDAELSLWDVATKKEIRVFKLPEEKEVPSKQVAFAAVYFAPDGKTLYAGTRAQGIRRYDLASGKELRSFPGHAWWVTGLHTTADGKTLISTSWDGTIRRWDLTTSKELPLPEGYVWEVVSAFSPDGKQVALADHVGRLDLWDVAGGKLLRTLQATGSGMTRIAFSPNGKTLAAACVDGVIRLWDPLTGKVAQTLTASDKQETIERFYMHLVLFSPDSSHLLVGSRQEGLRLWNVAAGKPIWLVRAKDDSMAAFSPDGKMLVTGGWTSRLSFRDLATGEEKRGVMVEADPEQRGQGTIIDSLAFSPNAKILATAHHDGLIRFWDPISATEVKKLRGHEQPVWTIRFSASGKWAVSGGVDNSVRIWDVASGKEIMKLVGQNAWVREADFSPDGKTILASGSTEALLWDARPRQPLGQNVAALWEDLLSTDAAIAFWAVWSLSGLDKEGPSFLEKQISPAKIENAKQLAKLIADLDSDQFATREAAAKALSELGARAEPALHEAVKNPTSSETERQLKLLIKDLDQGPTPEDIRRSRAIQALELAATPEARKVLAAWAKGASGARLTEDSQAAVDRLKKR